MIVLLSLHSNKVDLGLFMELEIKFKMNEKLFLRDPEETALGKKIIRQGLLLINRIGFEEFTFRKLAVEIDTTEAGIYRYFENKHRLLVYLTTWYWSWVEYKLNIHTSNLSSAEQKLHRIIRLLVEDIETPLAGKEAIPEKEAHQLVVWEGSKAYLTRHVSKDNQDRLFKPYKDLCERIARIIQEYNASYPFSHSLASSLLELSHNQKYFKDNLPSLTDFSTKENDERIIQFLDSLIFSALKN